jgi:IclR family acetate operon transcriptional repressor
MAARRTARLGAAEGGALARALAVAETVASAPSGATAAEVAARTGLAPSTVHRVLAQLLESGALAREPGGRRFAPGLRLVGLAWSALRHDRGTLRHAILARLVEEIGETCNLTLRDRERVVYLDRVEAHWPLRLHLQPGSHVPLHCTASGKVFLAAVPPARLHRLLATLPLGTGGPNVIASAVAMRKEIARTRKEGVGIDNQEFLAGLVAVAVPVRDAAGRTVAAVAVHGPAARFPLARALDCVPRLRAAAAEIAAVLTVNA